MLKNVLNRQISFGRISLILLFVGGLVFAGTYNGFVVETEAQTSCCGSTDAPTAEVSCCGGGTEVSKLSNAEVGDCFCIPAGSSDCSYCEDSYDCKDEGYTNSCSENCAQKDNTGGCDDCSHEDAIDCAKAGDKCSNPSECKSYREIVGDRSGGAEG